MKKNEEIFNVVNTAIDLAFAREKYELNFYDYLQSKKFKRSDVINFISSSLGISILNQIEELDIYIKNKPQKSYIKESYEWMGENRIRKVRDYLYAILDDANRYEKSKRPGRKPKTTDK